MTTAIWANKSILKNNKAFDKKKHLSKRPKGMTDLEWKEYVNGFKMEKLIFMDKAPKPKNQTNASRRDEE